jgi:hypothetical protein
MDETIQSGQQTRRGQLAVVRIGQELRDCQAQGVVFTDDQADELAELLAAVGLAKSGTKRAGAK